MDPDPIPLTNGTENLDPDLVGRPGILDSTVPDILHSSGMLSRMLASDTQPLRLYAS